MPRLYREAPLQSVWEGSGNVAALDALRALTRQLRKDAADPSEQGARRLAESMTVTLPAGGCQRVQVRHAGGHGPGKPAQCKPASTILAIASSRLWSPSSSAWVSPWMVTQVDPVRTSKPIP